MLSRVLAILLLPVWLLAQSLGPLQYSPRRTVVAPHRPPTAAKPAPAPPQHRLGKVRQSEIDAVKKDPLLELKGVERPLDEEDIVAAGQWVTLDDGTRVWRLDVLSDGAFGVRVHFTNFNAGNGNVWVHNADNSQTFGPFTGAGPDDSGDFWSNVVFGEEVIIEYQPDGEGDMLPFTIESIAHFFPALDTMSAGTCEVDVSCNSTWASTASGVGMYIFQKGGGTYACTGALVNNSKLDSKPYFLTANHCVSDAATAATVNVFWNYQTPSCNGTPPSLSSLPQTLGATFLAGKAIALGDFTLLQLGALPAKANLVFYGWNAAATALNVGDATVAIHHPAADFKRISLGLRDPDQTASIGSDLAPAAYYYQIRNTSGRIEPGSSGSPLFGPDKTIVGTLTYGPAGSACSISPFSGGYGRFATAYSSLASYLSPTSSSGTGGNSTTPPPAMQFTVAPAALTFNWTIGATAPAATVLKLTPTTTTASVTYTVAASQSWIKLSASSVSGTQTQPASVTVTVDPSAFTAAGNQTGTITLTAPDRTSVTVSVQLTITALVTQGVATVVPMWVDATGMTTTLTLSNPYSTATTARVTFLSPNGVAFAPPLAAGSSTIVTIPAHGTATIATAGTSSPQKQGIALIAASEPSKRVPVQTLLNNDAMPSLAPITPPFSVAFDATGAASSTVMVYNPGATTVTISLAVYDFSGTAIGSGSMTIPAGQQGSIAITKTATVFGGRKGLLTLSGTSAVQALVLRVASDGRMSAFPPATQ